MDIGEYPLILVLDWHAAHVHAVSTNTCQEGLKRGFEVTVFTRSNSPFENSNERVVCGELIDSGAGETLVARGCDKGLHGTQRGHLEQRLVGVLIT